MSSGGSSIITLQFSLDLNIDVAEQEVQAAINAASNFLPNDLPSPPIYSKSNPADAPVLMKVLQHRIRGGRGEPVLLGHRPAFGHCLLASITIDPGQPSGLTQGEVERPAAAHMRTRRTQVPQ